MLNHKDPHRVKSWLADLTVKGFLNRAYSRKFGDNTKPAVYFLATKSRNILKKLEEVNPTLLNRIYQEKARSQSFRDRSMFIANIYLDLEAQTKKNKGNLHFFTKTDLEVYNYLPEPLPDAYIALEEKSQTKRYFLEIISEQVPRFVLRNRIEYLFEYYDDKTWQDNTKHPFPKILMVCPNYVIKGFLSKFIAQTLENEGVEISFYLTARDQIEARGMQLDIWEKVE